MMRIVLRVCLVASIVIKSNVANQNHSCSAVSEILSNFSSGNQNSTDAVLGGVCALPSSCCSSRTEALIDTDVTVRYQTQIHGILSARTKQCDSSTVYDLLYNFIGGSKAVLVSDLRSMYGVFLAPYLTLFDNFYGYLQQAVYTRNTCQLKDQFYQVFFNLYMATYHAFASATTPPDTPEFRNCTYRYFLATQGPSVQSYYNVFSRPFDALLSYLLALNTSDVVLGSIGSPLFTRGCNVSLARMLACPYCAGYGGSGLGAEPCQGMCLNTFRGCLVDFAELAEPLSKFVSTMATFASALKTDYSPWDQITLLENKFFIIINNVYSGWSTINSQFTAQCNTGSSKRSTFHPIARRSTQSTLMAALITAINSSATCLRPLPPLLATLPEATCSSLQAVPTNEQCWNGQDLEGYHKNISQPGIPSQFSNPEVLVCPWGGREYNSQAQILTKVTTYMKVKLGLCSVDDEDCVIPTTSCDLQYAVPMATNALQGVGAYESGSGSGSGSYGDECAIPTPGASPTPTPQAQEPSETTEEFEPCSGEEIDASSGTERSMATLPHSVLFLFMALCLF